MRARWLGLNFPAGAQRPARATGFGTRCVEAAALATLATPDGVLAVLCVDLALHAAAAGHGLRRGMLIPSRLITETGPVVVDVKPKDKLEDKSW
jgi:hypothetical protein